MLVDFVDEFCWQIVLTKFLTIWRIFFDDFFDEICWRILMTNFLNEFYWRFFCRIFFGRFLLTYNLLTIAMFWPFISSNFHLMTFVDPACLVAKISIYLPNSQHSRCVPPHGSRESLNGPTPFDCKVSGSSAGSSRIPT